VQRGIRRQGVRALRDRARVAACRLLLRRQAGLVPGWRPERLRDALLPEGRQGTLVRPVSGRARRAARGLAAVRDAAGTHGLPSRAEMAVAVLLDPVRGDGAV